MMNRGLVNMNKFRNFVLVIGLVLNASSVFAADLMQILPKVEPKARRAAQKLAGKKTQLELRRVVNSDNNILDFDGMTQLTARCMCTIYNFLYVSKGGKTECKVSIVRDESTDSKNSSELGPLNACRARPDQDNE